DNQSKKYRLATASQDALAETIIKSWSQNNESIKQAFDANVRKNNQLLIGASDLSERHKRQFEALI
ncbi:TPA: hypothetical protein MEA99_004165, partial [Klebsiella aerogenes]|nr:hypothetical protein [Klebsiella aerogenes]